MPLLLRKVTAEDAQTLTEVYFSAFQKDAISLLVFPRNDSSRDFWTSSIISELQDPSSHFICIYSSSAPEEIIAYAKWNDPNASSTAPELPVWPEGGDQELGNEFFGNLVKGRERIMKGRKHWYLEFIATRQEWQGKGAGGMLIRWGVERSDDDGTETYLEASPEGLPIYKRFGFEEVERFAVDVEGKGEGVLGVDEKEFVEVFMVRPVGGKKMEGSKAV